MPVMENKNYRNVNNMSSCNNSIEDMQTCNCACQEENTVNCDLRRKMIEQIRCCEFAITELALYLDTHPEDEKALCLHRKYTREARDLKDKYQKVYGPLTINFPCNKWRWLEEPWPWERGNY